MENVDLRNTSYKQVLLENGSGEGRKTAFCTMFFN